MSKIGVDVRVELSGVGENVQEHLLFSINYELDPDAAHETADLIRNPEYAAKAMQFQCAVFLHE